MADPDFGRIKRNVSKMIDLGAPEADIDAYLSQESVTPEQLRAAPKAAAPAPEAPAQMVGSVTPQPENPGVMGTIKNEAGNALQAGEDIIRLMGKGAAMGKQATPEDATDRAAAVADIGRRMARGRVQQQPQMSLPQYQEQFANDKQALADAEKRAGWAGTAAEVVGSVAPAAAISKLYQMGATAAAPVLGKMATNPLANAGATGATIGLVDAAGTDKDKGTNAALGALFGVGGQAVANAATGLVSKAAGAFNKAPNIPTKEAIGAAKSAAYDAADQAGVVFTPKLFERVRANVTQELADLGYSPRLQPKIAAVIDELATAAENNVTLKGADVVRRIASNAYEPGNKANNAMVTRIVNALDDAVSAPKAGEVLAGDAAKAAEALKAGRSNASIEFKLEKITQALQKAERQADRTYSGSNLDNAVRQKISALLDNPGRTRGFTADERAAMEQIVKGTPMQNAMRIASKLLPSTGLGGMMNFAGSTAIAGPLGVLAPIAGAAMRKGSQAAARSNVAQLENIIRAGGSRAATRPAENAVQRLTRSKREALARALAVAPFAQ